MPEFLVTPLQSKVPQGHERDADLSDHFFQNAFAARKQQTEVLEWAGKNLSDKEMETVNKQFESGDMNTVRSPSTPSRASMRQRTVSLRQAPRRRRSSHFRRHLRSWDEVSRDMDNEKYHSDPAFRAQVEKKLANSKNL